MILTETDRILLLLDRAAKSRLSLNAIVSEEIREFRKSEGYRLAGEAEQYFRNRSAVQDKKNRFQDRSNTKIEHGYVRRLTNQKVNTLLAQPFSVATENKAYGNALAELFDDSFRSKIYSFGRAGIKHAIGWLHPYFDEAGRFCLKKLPFQQVVPLWKDAEHTQMDEFIYFFPQIEYAGADRRVIWRAEYWNTEGVWYFVDKNRTGYYSEDTERGSSSPHFWLNGNGYVWDTVPLIWCKYNEEELPLHYYIKELVDDYNWQKSVTADVLRDVAKFIIKLKGYGGTDVNQFMEELRDAFVIKLQSDGEAEKMETTLDIGAVIQLLDVHRRDIYENGGGVDTQNPELSALSARAQRLRFTDLITDCNGLANELKGAFKRLKLFIDVYLQIIGKGNFTGESFDVTFNMDLPTDETEIFQNAQMAGLERLSQRTILNNIPWVKDVETELQQIGEETKKQEERARLFGFPNDNPVPGEDGGGEGDDNG